MELLRNIPGGGEHTTQRQCYGCWRLSVPENHPAPEASFPPQIHSSASCPELNHKVQYILMNLKVRENVPFQVILAQLEGDQSS